MHKELTLLESEIGYTFKDPSLLKKSMIHSSYANERHLQKNECNERLEFLGDAVLELITSEYLFEEYRKMPEGDLTKTRASLVCEKALAFCARELNLGDYILLGKGEETTGGRGRDSIISDAMEALVGAVYLDGGYRAASAFIKKFILKEKQAERLFSDSKTALQEIVQASTKDRIIYHLIKEEGPDHNKCFYIQVSIGQERFGTGRGRTKKAAEQEAANATIIMLNSDQRFII
ncbi:MAG: ribonuclease III [Lachnospiraceae bacterium]|jgi:ribonuclease-3|nr:ribonuclease III [Lachnospiraceae bacterium]